MNNMCRIAHEKTDSAMIAAYICVGSDAAPHSPTLRWKLNTRKITRRSPRWKFQSMAAPPTHVPQPHLLEALRHVRQSRGSSHARLVVLPFFQHQVLPRRHFGRSGFACPIIGVGLSMHSHTRTIESDGSLSSRCQGNQEVDQGSDLCWPRVRVR